jgi:hypothetical protein
VEWLKVEPDSADDKLLVIAGSMFLCLGGVALFYFMVKDLLRMIFG